MNYREYIQFLPDCANVILDSNTGYFVNPSDVFDSNGKFILPEGYVILTGVILDNPMPFSHIMTYSISLPTICHTNMPAIVYTPSMQIKKSLAGDNFLADCEFDLQQKDDDVRIHNLNGIHVVGNGTISSSSSGSSSEQSGDTKQMLIPQIFQNIRKQFEAKNKLVVQRTIDDLGATFRITAKSNVDIQVLPKALFQFEIEIPIDEVSMHIVNRYNSTYMKGITCYVKINNKKDINRSLSIVELYGLQMNIVSNDKDTRAPEKTIYIIYKLDYTFQDGGAGVSNNPRMEEWFEPMEKKMISILSIRLPQTKHIVNLNVKTPNLDGTHIDRASLDIMQEIIVKILANVQKKKPSKKKRKKKKQTHHSKHGYRKDEEVLGLMPKKKSNFAFNMKQIWKDYEKELHKICS